MLCCSVVFSYQKEICSSYGQQQLHPLPQPEHIPSGQMFVTQIHLFALQQLAHKGLQLISAPHRLKLFLPNLQEEQNQILHVVYRSMTPTTYMLKDSC